MKLVGLIRVSTEEQAAEGREGLGRQRDAVEAIVKAQGATLVAPIFEVVDVSGSDLADTSEWREILRHIGDTDTHLAIQNVNRLARVDKFDFRVLADIQRTGTKVYTPGGEQDPTNATGAFVLGLLGLIGGLDKQQIKDQMMAGKEKGRAKGRWVQPLSWLPTGVSYDRDTSTWGITPEAETVRLAYRLLVEDGKAVASIARTIGMTPAGVREMLRNTIYQGILTYDQRRGAQYRKRNGRQPDRRKVARKPEEIIRVRVFSPSDQIVSDDVWQAAQARLNEARTTTRKRREKGAPDIWASSYLHSSLAGIPTTGIAYLDITEPRRHVLYGKHSGRHHPPKYQCRCTASTKHDPGAPKPKCGVPMFLAGEMNKALDAALVLLCQDKRYIAAVIAQMETQERDVEGETTRIRKALDGLSKKEEKLVDLYMNDRIDTALYDRKRDSIQKERDALQTALDRLAGTDDRLDVEAVQRHLEGLSWDVSWDAQQKRDWLTKNVSSIGVSGHGIEAIVLRIPGAGMPVYTAAGPWSWETLVGYDITHPEARYEAQHGRYFASTVAERLGVKADKLARMIRLGQVEPPAEKRGLKWVWTENEVERFRAALGV